MGAVGVLALQGGFAPHLAALAACGYAAVPVRTAAQLSLGGVGDAGLSALVLPGGESTAQLKLIAADGLGPALSRFVASGRPVVATCAGLILAARTVRSPAQHSFAWLDVVCERNAWGTQLDSFEAFSDDGAWPLVLIRAPRLVEVGPEVEVLARYGGEPVLVRQRGVVGATFHPELDESRAGRVAYARILALAGLRG